MTEKDKTYVCDPCGIEVKVVKEGGGTLICCGEEMEEKEEEKKKITEIF